MRKGESMEEKENKKNKWKKGAWIGAGIGVVGANAVLGLGSYAMWRMMHPKRLEHKENPSNYEMEYENVSFKSRDEVELSGWWIENEDSKKVAILSHAYGLNRSRGPFSMLRFAKFVKSMGYNVLLYDFRNAGESGGSETTLGEKEQWDVHAAIDFTKEEKGMEQIVLFGWSMGASASLLAGCEREDVQGIVADSPFSCLESYLKDSFHYWTKLPKIVGKLSTPLAKKNVFGFKPSGVNPIDAIRNMKEKKILLIHASDDPAISCEESEKMEKLHDKVVLWKPEKGGHIETYKWHRKAYEEKIRQFLNSL